MSSTNSWYFVGAAMIGIISAAGVFIIEHFRHERRRHVMDRDLARMDQQLSSMRRDLEQLRTVQKDKNEKRSKKIRRRNISVVSNTTSDEYTSVADIESSDMEFYDLSDDEDVTRTFHSTLSLQRVLEGIDEKLDCGRSSDIMNCLEKLKELCEEYPESPELLWRIGKAHYNIAMTCADVVEKQDNINNGIEACNNALDLNYDLPEVHKWYAILIGSRSDFQSTKDKISDGHIFKKHIDIAVNLNPSDPTLHHLLGRFAYEVASLKWYERKVAAALYGEPPTATYQDALDHFMRAEELSSKEWKENKLLIGKCHLACSNPQLAVEWLAKAGDIQCKDELDEQFDIEIRTLLAKYNSYR